MAVIRAEPNSESEMGLLEFARNIIRPAVLSIRPQVTYKPHLNQGLPANIDLKPLDRAIINLKEKMVLLTELDEISEFETERTALLEKGQSARKDVQAALDAIDKLKAINDATVTVSDLGVIRVELTNTGGGPPAFFELCCDTENYRFKGIRCEPKVENFEEFVAQQVTLNDIVVSMVRRCKKLSQL